MFLHVRKWLCNLPKYKSSFQDSIGSRSEERLLTQWIIQGRIKYRQEHKFKGNLLGCH